MTAAHFDSDAVESLVALGRMRNLRLVKVAVCRLHGRIAFPFLHGSAQ